MKYKNHPLNNHVIEVLTLSHGQDVIKFFKKNGIDTGDYTGNCTKDSNNLYRFYGIINGHFDNYTMDKIRQNKVKIVTLEEISNINKIHECW